MSTRQVCEDSVKESINSAPLAFAIRQWIFCEYCKEPMDVDNAVLVDGSRNAQSSTLVMCAECWDFGKDRFLQRLAANDITVEIITGRDLTNVRISGETLNF